MSYRVLDLFSAAAGGWSLGMHRAGFTTVAACEVEEWRRILYSENNPHVRLYDDVRTLTSERLAADGIFPDIVVGSPPCQDISSANTKGKGVDGDRSKLFFEAIRIVGEIRPRWVALENSAHLRTKGADRVLGALEALGYACWPLVVRARDVGANHERPRVWIIAADIAQLADADGAGRPAEWRGRGRGVDVSDAQDTDGGQSADAYGCVLREQSGWRSGKGRRGEARPEATALHPARLGYGGGRPRGHRPDGLGAAPASFGHDADAACLGQSRVVGNDEGRWWSESEHSGVATWDSDDATQDGRGQGGAGRRAEPASRLRVEACGDAALPDADHQRQPDGAEHDEVGGSSGAGGAAAEPWADWNSGLAGHLRVDDGLSAWVAGARVAVGGPRGTAAAALLVEAFGDAVVPQIPEAIGRAILRTEAALAAIYGRVA